MDGGILQILLKNIDLPEAYTQKKLTEMFSVFGKKPEEIGLEELRQIVASYMQDVLLEMKSE